MGENGGLRKANLASLDIVGVAGVADNAVVVVWYAIAIETTHMLTC